MTKLKRWQCQKCKNFVEPWRYCIVCNAHFTEIKEVEVDDKEYPIKAEIASEKTAEKE